MKRSYQQRTLSELALFCSLMIISSTSCVNEEYNLDKEIDLTVSVLKDISLPVGSLQKVSLSELLGLPDDTSVIASDNSGNLHFTLSDDQNILSQSITVPYFDFNDSYRGKVVERYLGSFLFSYNESYADYINLNDISTPRAFPDIPVEIEFEDDAIDAIAELAIERNTGARGLRSIMEGFLMPLMYSIPSREDIAKIIITRETVINNAEPKYILK